jgi:hypothetical protein
VRSDITVADYHVTIIRLDQAVEAAEQRGLP